jgi:hypothetical protein
MTGAGIPAPSEATLLRLAAIAAHVEELMAADHQMQRAPVGLRNLKNDRRRTVEAVLLLLADPEVRKYVAELKKLGVLPA